MHQFSASPIEMFATLWRNRALIKALSVREVQARYRSSIMGIFWSFLNPLFMLSIYTFVFSAVFKARWNTGGDSRTEFALLLFSGLMVFNLFAECINHAPRLVLSNSNYVKKVVFPLEILPCVILASALFHSVISLGIWLLAYMVFFGMPHATLLYLPLIALPFLLFILGLSWLFASLGVYLRDISHIVGLLTTALLFLSPVFYPVSALPETYRPLLYFNPITPVIEQTRDVLFFGRAPDFAMLGIYGGVTTLFAWAGFSCFQKTRAGFADVL